MEQQITVERISTTEIVVRGSEALREWRERNRYFVPGYEFVPRFQQWEHSVKRLRDAGLSEEDARTQASGWNGTWAPGRWCHPVGDPVWALRCSFGFLPRLQRELTFQVPFQVGAEAKLIVDFFTQARVDELGLRDYQKVALAAALSGGWGRVAMATNAGKGAVIGLMAAYAKQHGLSALILCDALSVYDALLGEIKKWVRLTPRRVQAGAKMPPSAGVTLAMVPTLARRLASKDREQRAAWHAWLERQHMLLEDEGDKVLADSWKSINRAAHGSWWRIGFSGTFSTDPYYDLLYDEQLGPTIAKVSNAELIARGVSARPRVELQGFDVTPALVGIKLSWRIRGAARRQAIFERAVMRNEARHAAIAALVRPDVLTVVIVNRVEHGHLLARAIGNAAFLDGSASADERECVLEAWRRGRGNVLVTTKILDRGTNRLGAAADIIFASGEGSPTQTLQRLGRGLRRAGGKEYLRLVDVIDRVVPGDDRTLESAAEFIHAGGRMRVQLYADEGFEAQTLP